MPFVSLVIPIYNVEQYLHQCVDSVLAQKLDNLEIILVDDGSPDSCPQICDEYAEKHSCIRVIHKENGGLSSARNAGISAASGQYIMFMDSDDWWNPAVNVQEMLNYVKKHTDVEMFLFTSFDYVENEGYLKRNEHNQFDLIATDSVSAYYNSLVQNGNFEVSACTKILKADFIMENNLIFRSGLLSEDNEWIMRVLRCLNKVDIISEPLYVCRTDRQTSITHTIKEKNISDLLYIVESSVQYCKANPDSPHTNQELCFAAYLWFCALGLSAVLDKDTRKKLRAEFDKNAWVCQYSSSRKTKLSAMVYHVCGYNTTIFILGTYIRLKSRHNITRKRVSK